MCWCDPVRELKRVYLRIWSQRVYLRIRSSFAIGIHAYIYRWDHFIVQFLCCVCSFPKTSRVRTNTERDRQRALRTRNETLSHGIAITTRAANDESSSSQWWILIIVQKATQEIKAAEPICDLCNTTSSKANLLPRAGIHFTNKMPASLVKE